MIRMWELSNFWLLIIIILGWAIFIPVVRVCYAFWEILVSSLNPKPIDLKSQFGEWAVVTGSTDGIGKAYAKELASRNINLVLISRTLEKLEKTKEEILSINPKIEIKIIVADFSKGKDIYEKLKKQLEEIPVGILVNNVGAQYGYPMYLEELPEEEIWNIINVNVGATTMMTRLIIGDMKKRGKGAIVNVSSGSEMQPLPLMTVYAATKIYVRSFSDAVRAEYSKFGITVQHLMPFFVNTKMNAFSDKLQISNILVPSPTTYARNAIAVLGIMDCSNGYWVHEIQNFFVHIAPVWIRTKIGLLMNEIFRKDYIKKQNKIY